MSMAVTLAALAALFLCSAFFSSSETVLFSLTPLQVRKLEGERPRVGRKLRKWLDRPEGVLSTILAGNALVNFAIASVGFLALNEAMGGSAAAEVASVPLFTVLLLVFGEIFPKQYAMRHAESMVVWCVPALTFFSWVLRPVSGLMMAGSKVFKNLLSKERSALSDEELRAVVESVAAKGELDREEALMVKGVMRLPDLYAMNEMTPRVKVKGIEAGLPDAEKVKMAVGSYYPFLPVYRGDMDHIEGFLDVHRLLLDPKRDVAAAIQAPLRVSEHLGLDDVLVIFMRTGRRIAVVQDRWGGTAGIITRGDILELIVVPVEDGAPRTYEPRRGAR